MSDRYENIRRALAMGPTPGPRTMLADEKILGLALPGRWVVEADGAYICLDPEWDEECYEESIANAALIAACDPGTIRALLAERDRLLDAAQVALAWSDPDWVGYETVKSAVDAALGQAPRACTCHPDDRPDGPRRERYAASECQALAAQQGGES